MSNEAQLFISNEVVELFEEIDDDCLADVLRVWDCDNQEWLDGTTTVFRLETDDLLVWNAMGSPRAERGAVDTQAFQHAALNGASEDSCLARRSDPPFSDYIGKTALSATLLEFFIEAV